MTMPANRFNRQFFPLDQSCIATSLEGVQQKPVEAMLAEGVLLNTLNESLQKLLVKIGTHTVGGTNMLGNDFFSSGALIAHRIVREAAPTPLAVGKFPDATLANLGVLFNDVTDLSKPQYTKRNALSSIVMPHMEAEPQLDAVLGNLAPDRAAMSIFHLGAGAMTACLRVHADDRNL